ncbi:Niemann-Pick C1 protein [Phytophthora nicotianae]|uniref:Niemann-Pick C1 protein n=1 Tax=Phytophthora nicotianae TaxID=4792 RepID=A0A0W8DSK5_PHYNI|nr:Niemann-Pick C1 protein [Phytophthora nicotianae]
MDEVKEEAAGSDTDDEDWKPQDEESKGAQMSTKKWDEIVEDSDEEWRRGEWENEDMQTEDENNEAVCDSDVAQAKFVLRNILSRVPLIEETAIRRGVKLSGPPLEFATTHLDEYARGVLPGLLEHDSARDSLFVYPVPALEGLKYQWSKQQNAPVSSLQGAVCGSIAGGVAASITTPLDVVKTRLMLGKDAKGVPYKGTLSTLSRVYTDEGLKRLFSGVGPRTMWISIGGFVFFGMYEKATSTFTAII